jgi:L-ribulose-5-phosphate 3-epimerase
MEEVIVKIGVRLESLELPFRRALAEAQRMGGAGVQFDAVGDLSPDGLTQTGRREVRTRLKGHELDLAALGCPLRRGLGAVEAQQQRIEHVRKVMDLAYELGTRVVVVEAGPIPEDPKSPEAGPLTEALLAIGQHGDRTGVTLALETGLESGETLARFLAALDTGGLGVNLDPANLLIHGFDPYEAARALHGRTVHVHAKDARKTSASREAQEVALGNGDIDWMQFLAVLEEVEYRGWLTLERESGDRKAADIAGGVAFLRRFIPPR